MAKKEAKKLDELFHDTLKDIYFAENLAPRDSHGSPYVSELVDLTLRSKSSGCRKPSEGAPDVAAGDTANRRARNSSGFAEHGGESPSSV